MKRILFILSSICILFILEVYTQPNNSTTTIKVGLLISNNKSLAARNGAEMAIDKANEKETTSGLHFQLEVRSMEGSWGTGSTQAVDLIFKENVWAILGSHDGKNAHLVEQATTKTRTVFLSAWASDPTLSQAFVPWYFSCVPNNIQQADALIEEIYNKRNISKIVVVSDKSYDSKLALQSLLKKTKISGKIEPMQLFYDNSNKSFEILLDKINKADINGIILFGQPTASLRFIQQLHQKKMNQPVFGGLSLLGEDEFNDEGLANYNNVTLISSGNWFGSKELSFQNDFQKKYGKMPRATAAYAFDGMNLIIEAIKRSGLDREKIQEAMSKIRYKGVTGLIQFDDKGNRVGVPNLIEISNGIAVTIEK